MHWRLRSIYTQHQRYGTIVYHCYYSFEFLQILYNNPMQRETLELVIMFWLHYRLSLIILYC